MEVFDWQFSTFLVVHSVEIHNNFHRDVYEGQRPFRFHFACERCRIGGQIFAVSSLPEACTVGSGLIKAARVSGKSWEDRKKRRDGVRKGERDGERERERTGEHGALVSHATQEVVAPVVDRYEHETRVSTYESPGGTFPYAAPSRAEPVRAGRRGISFRVLFRLKSCPPLARAQGFILSFMYESKSFVIVVPSARARPWPRWKSLPFLFF